MKPRIGVQARMAALLGIGVALILVALIPLLRPYLGMA